MTDLGHDRRAKRLRWDGLTPERRARFLEALVETRSVTKASMMAGKRHSSCFYQLRGRDPEFARDWDAALASVSAALEADLTARAMVAIDADAEIALAPLDFNETMRLLAYFRSRDKGTKFGPARRYATRQETDAALMKKLDVLEARVRAREKKEREARKAARARAAETPV
jgi:hypothetical protein